MWNRVDYEKLVRIDRLVFGTPKDDGRWKSLGAPICKRLKPMPKQLKNTEVKLTVSEWDSLCQILHNLTWGTDSMDTMVALNQTVKDRIRKQQAKKKGKKK